MKWLEEISRKIMHYIIVIAITTIMVLNCVFTARVAYDESEKVSYFVQPQSIIFAVVMGIIICSMFCGLKKFSEKTIFVAFTIMYIAIMIYMVLNIKVCIRADAKYVLDAAKQISNGNYASLKKGGYLYIYPNQLGLVSYDRILLKICKNEKIMYIINLFEIILINWFGYRISNLIFKCNVSVNKIVIILEFLFLPQLFFIMFAYGLIPGFCAMIAAFYFVLKFIEHRKISMAIISAVLCVIAAVLKMNFLIGAIAVFIILFLDFMKNKEYRSLALALVIIMGTLMSGKVIGAIYEFETGVEKNNGIPSTAWIAMGTDLENTEKAPGWYDISNYATYTLDANYDSEKAGEISQKKIKDNLKKSIENPGRTIKFYGKKIVSMWCEPMFQSVWSGPCIDTKDYVQSTILNSLYSGKNVEKVCSIFIKALVLNILIFSCIFRWRSSQYREKSDLLYLFFLGGIIFHIFWEGKSQYTYPYVFVLIPGCAYEFEKILMRFKKCYK